MVKIKQLNLDAVNGQVGEVSGLRQKRSERQSRKGLLILWLVTSGVALFLYLGVKLRQGWKLEIGGVEEITIEKQEF